MQGDDLRQSETFLQLAGIHELASNEAMTPQLLALIRCPQCREGNLKVVGGASGELICQRCATSVAVVDGVPRLAGMSESYASSFGRQWNRYDVARPAEDEATFRIKTGVPASDLAGRLVLDAGCGGGRYARLLGQHGAQVVGVDLSAAVAKASSLCASFPDVLILQGDLLDLPLVESAFDLVYSIGVLHHTPDPRRAFGEIARRVKPGGALPFGSTAATLFRKNG